MSGGPTGPTGLGFTPGATGPAGERPRAGLPQAATMPVDDMTYLTLYEHSQQLGKLSEWDGSGLFATAGVLLVGGGVGALASGVYVGTAGVLVCLLVGLALLLGSLLIKRKGIVDARSLKSRFDQSLSLYEDQTEEIRELRRRLDSRLPPEPSGKTQRVLHFFGFRLGGERHDSLRGKPTGESGKDG